MIYPIQKSSSFDFIKEARKEAKNRMKKSNEPKHIKKIKRHTNDVQSFINLKYHWILYIKYNKRKKITLKYVISK